jgi:putative ABC transport system substrate-binding protein
MLRREFLAFLGSVVAACPLTLRAQQRNRVWRIGILMGFRETDPEGKLRVEAFRARLQDLGWMEGRNLQIHYRWTAGEGERIRPSAQELLSIQPDVIIGQSSPVVSALLQETRTIPIIFVNVADPIGGRFVNSFAQPGGNVTGFTTIEPSLGGKWVELLKTVAPHLARVGFLFNPETSIGTVFLRAIEDAARSFALEPRAMPVRNVADLDRSIADFGREPGGGLIIMADVFMGVHRERIAALAASHDLASVYPFRVFALAGGLVSYGVDQAEQFRLAASYVDRILKGAKPADLPVQAPTKYELVINLKTAKALGLTVPTSLLARADEVIE